MTTVYGLPCRFVKFDEMPKRGRKEGFAIEDVTKRNLKILNYEAFVRCKNLDNLEKELNDFIKSERMVNVRGKIWPIMCNLPDLQDTMLKQHDKDRLTRKLLLQERAQGGENRTLENEEIERRKLWEAQFFKIVRPEDEKLDVLR